MSVKKVSNISGHFFYGAGLSSDRREDTVDNNRKTEYIFTKREVNEHAQVFTKGRNDKPGSSSRQTQKTTS
jgi:hypothetical protein